LSFGISLSFPSKEFNNRFHEWKAVENFYLSKVVWKQYNIDDLKEIIENIAVIMESSSCPFTSPIVFVVSNSLRLKARGIILLK
jgi:hypothetical protein